MAGGRLLAILVVAAVAATPALCADSKVGPGAKVRVSAPTMAGGTLKGRVQAFDDQALTLTSGKETVVSPRASITRLEVAFGRRGNARKGAIIGGAAGLLFLISLCNDGSTDCSGPWAEKFAAVGLVGGGYAGVAAIIGTAIRTDKWVEVPLGSAALGWRVEPKRGVRVGLVLRF